MNLLSILLPWRRKRAARPRPRPDEAALLALPAQDGEDDDRPRGCGWFDSSHELQHGLSVREHASPDTLGRELPLANWLELQLSNWRPADALANQT